MRGNDGNQRFWRPAAIASYSAGRFSGVRAAIAWHGTLSEMGIVMVSSTIAVGPIAQTLAADDAPIGAGGEAIERASQAYIRSQAHAGWSLVKARYDDGGFSGGSTDRPALQRLLADILAGRIHIIVVYKVDRLTRSLADFAKASYCASSELNS